VVGRHVPESPEGRTCQNFPYDFKGPDFGRPSRPRRGGPSSGCARIAQPRSLRWLNYRYGRQIPPWIEPTIVMRILQ
jgi:hypothetical protein